MRVDYIVLAIPVFFALIGVELIVARWQGRSVYRLNDSVNDLPCLGAAAFTLISLAWLRATESGAATAGHGTSPVGSPRM